jgi:amino acid adenylation domain-containing protein
MSDREATGNAGKTPIISAKDNTPFIANGSYPLSPVQEGMLYLSIAEPGAGAYVLQLLCHLKESLDVPLFLECWREIISLHPILRTFFRWEDLPEPRQFVMPEVSAPVTEIDLRGLSAEERTRRLDAFLDTDRRLGLDLTRAPLMRLAVFRLADAEYQVLWTVHHLLVDGRSMGVVLQQVFTCYGARKCGRACELPTAPPYGAYVDWLGKQPTASAEIFWRKHMEGLSGTTTFPLPAPVIDDSGLRIPRHACLRIEESLTAEVETFASIHGLTLNVVLMGAWAFLLHRYGDTQDVVFGATKAVRHCPTATPSSVGVFINTLPVRTHVDAETRLLPWLEALRGQWISLREFEHTAPGTIRACSGIPGGMPLFGTCYVFERERLNDSLRALGGDWREREVQIRQRTPLPIILAAYGGKSIDLAVEYDGHHFDPDSVSRILEHLRIVLQGMVSKPEARLVELPILTERERRQLLFDWQPSILESTPACIHELVERAALRTPNAPAVRFVDACMSYRELNARACQFAHYLRELGVTSEARVGMCMSRSIEMIVGLVGILKAGGTYVPMDPAYPTERLEFMLTDSEASVLVTERSLVSRFSALPPRVVCLDEETAQLALRPDEELRNVATPENLAYIIYTSGSTGQPKGVCVAHREAASHFTTMRVAYGIVPEDRLLQSASIGFDVSLEQIFVALTSGATLVIADARAWTPADFSSFLRDAQISMVNIPPAFWQQWTEEGIARGRDDFGPQLRLLVVGSDVAPPETVQKWQRRPATVAVRLVNAYGPTETVITATLFDIPAGFSDVALTRRVPIGRPVPGTETYILDKYRNPVPVGVTGELYIGGNRLARGYLNRPELTKESFVPHPFSNCPGARLYRTGDLARYLADGNIEFLGRADHQVKIRGFRIELGEIEATLLGHVCVREAVVLRREDRPGEPQLAAYVVAKETNTIDVRGLRDHLRTRLPDYMVPSAFVLLDTLPLTVSGKVDRQALPAPERDAFAADGARVEPRTNIERLLANIWQEILKIDPLGIHDNFFDLGGHSLLATQVISRVRNALQLDVPLRKLFEAPTIAAFAATVEEALLEEVETLTENEASQRLEEGCGP